MNLCFSPLPSNNSYFACYALAAYIFSFSAWRDLVFHEMMVEQGKWVFLDNDIAFYAGAALFAWGGTLVLSSMWALGVTGTYLGDYMGILMDDRVTGFPFNVTEHPMYRGSALSFLGHALMGASAPGLLVALAVHVAYLLAELFEGPFTAGIYAKRDADRAAAKGKGNKTRKAD